MHLLKSPLFRVLAQKRTNQLSGNRSDFVIPICRWKFSDAAAKNEIRNRGARQRLCLGFHSFVFGVSPPAAPSPCRPAPKARQGKGGPLPCGACLALPCLAPLLALPSMPCSMPCLPSFMPCLPPPTDRAQRHPHSGVSVPLPPPPLQLASSSSSSSRSAPRSRINVPARTAGGGFHKRDGTCTVSALCCVSCIAIQCCCQGSVVRCMQMALAVCWSVIGCTGAALIVRAAVVRNRLMIRNGAYHLEPSHIQYVCDCTN